METDGKKGDLDQKRKLRDEFIKVFKNTWKMILL